MHHPRLRMLAVAPLLLPPAVAAAQSTPGAAGYWQQEVHYTIEAKLDEEAERLEAAGTLVYHNASPDALDEIYFHLYLNAFRPNSIWTQTEQRPEYDFQSLDEPYYGYERLTSMRAGSDVLAPEYPFAPDSTVVRFALPQPIAPGASRTFTFEWQARPSIRCRRQCRSGRSWDFAQWYPRVAVYDRDGWEDHPLYPQGEFYGEYGTYDVTLDLAADQVVGATGAVLEGDPGWVPAATSPLDVAPLQSSWYAQPLDPISPDFLPASAPQGRKRVRFYGENIHHFAWSTSPDYRYEGAMQGDVAVHVLFRPGDLDWDLGAAVYRSVRALEWLESVFGPYPYPQITNLHRLEAGGTEFPMVIMDGDAGQSLIAHELAHQYAMGALGSNEWKEAWLDEGMATFLASWFTEDVGGINPWPPAVQAVGRVEGQGALPLPVETSSEDFPSYDVYGVTEYNKGSIVLRMLRELVGPETMRRGLALYYETHRFQHVTEDDLREAVEEASGRDLDWFFDQWLHTTATLDYAVADAETRGTPEGWHTTATITRQGDAWMPVTVQVGSERIVLEDRERIQSIDVVTDERPAEVVIDPDVVLLDSNPDNNRVAIES